jgi:RNA polymerase sigma-70 factor (ECF subfamily)
MSKKTIHTIVNRAKQGSQTAYKELLNIYWGDVYRFLVARCENDYTAEDITIKAFSKAFDKLELFNPDYSFKNWLLTIASNLHIDHLRAQKKQIKIVSIEKEKVVGIADITPTSEDKLIQEQHLAELLRYIKQLKPHYRKVINLHYFQEMSYREISEEIGESLSNVKVKLLRARKLLSELIKEK